MVGPPLLRTDPNTNPIRGPLSVTIKLFGYFSVHRKLLGRKNVSRMSTSILGTLCVEKQGPLNPVKYDLLSNFFLFWGVSFLNSICFNPMSIISYAPKQKVNLQCTTFVVVLGPLLVLA